MSFSYTPTPTRNASHTLPSDGDARNAASVNTTFQSIADDLALVGRDVEQVIADSGHTLAGSSGTALLDAIDHILRRTTALDYALVEDDGSDPYMGIASDPDGDEVILVGWAGRIRYVDHDGPQSVTSGTSADLLSIAHGNGFYAAVGNDTGVPYSRKGTSHGTSWAAGLSGTSDLPDIVRDIGYCTQPSLARPWIVVGDSGTYGEWAELTADLTTSSSLHTTTNPKFTAIAMGNLSPNYDFMVVGETGFIGTAVPGGGITVRTSGTSEHLRDVAYSAFFGLWIAVGDNGTILTSPDMINWTARTSPEAGEDWMVVDASGECIVIIGNSGCIWAGRPTSWRKAYETGVQPAYSIHLAQGRRYYLGGPSGRIYRSRSF